MNLGLDMSLKLQQKLSFQMIQSLKLLQVNTLQLEQLLKTELEMNPVLETVEDEETEQDETEEKIKDKDGAEEEKELEVNEDKVDWEEYLEEGFGSGESNNDEDSGREYYEPAQVYQPTLEESLEKQLSEKKLDDNRKLLVEFLINSLDADGYLRISTGDIAEVAGVSIAAVEEALQILWGMEPAGIGARNLQECLRLQLIAKRMNDSIAMRIVNEAWELFEKWKILYIAKQLNVDQGEIQRAVDFIKTLNPKPGSLVAGDKISTIVPDLIVEKVDDEFVIMLNDRSTPTLHINRSYAKMLSRGSTVQKDVKNYIREKLNSASWLVRSIEQRRTTMLKVMHAIVLRQKEFFEKGPPHLAPLKLQDIADMIAMHISTVSRVTSNKYVQTPHGIFELKYFFPEAMGHDSNGEDISSETIKNRIRELVDNENSKKSLSDKKISDILLRENLKVARRTVAKYREQLKILPARLRQKYD
ncbi:MAG TPA: RNA polymerase sigma-54 factor [Fibrobacteres bacterium]|nr:RNA polymerase sigma-54 factor [Fibrobacterota bacterium]